MNSSTVTWSIVSLFLLVLHLHGACAAICSFTSTTLASSETLFDATAGCKSVLISQTRLTNYVIRFDIGGMLSIAPTSSPVVINVTNCALDTQSAFVFLVKPGAAALAPLVVNVNMSGFTNSLLVFNGSFPASSTLLVEGITFTGGDNQFGPNGALILMNFSLTGSSLFFLTSSLLVDTGTATGMLQVFGSAAISNASVFALQDVTLQHKMSATSTVNFGSTLNITNGSSMVFRRVTMTTAAGQGLAFLNFASSLVIDASSTWLLDQSFFKSTTSGKFGINVGGVLNVTRGSQWVISYSNISIDNSAHPIYFGGKVTIAMQSSMILNMSMIIVNSGAIRHSIYFGSTVSLFSQGMLALLGSTVSTGASSANAVQTSSVTLSADSFVLFRDTRLVATSNCLNVGTLATGQATVAGINCSAPAFSASTFAPSVAVRCDILNGNDTTNALGGSVLGTCSAVQCTVTADCYANSSNSLSTCTFTQCPCKSGGYGALCAPATSAIPALPVSPATPVPTPSPPTTARPSTAAPTTLIPSTMVPSTMRPSTAAPTTSVPTTRVPTTVAPATAIPSTVAATAQISSVQSTAEPTTVAPSTLSPPPLLPCSQSLSAAQCGYNTSCTWCMQVGTCIAALSSCPASCIDLPTAAAAGGCSTSQLCHVCPVLGYCVSVLSPCASSCLELIDTASCTAAVSCHWCARLGNCKPLVGTPRQTSCATATLTSTITFSVSSSSTFTSSLQGMSATGDVKETRGTLTISLSDEHKLLSVASISHTRSQSSSKRHTATRCLMASATQTLESTATVPVFCPTFSVRTIPALLTDAMMSTPNATNMLVLELSASYFRPGASIQAFVDTASQPQPGGLPTMAATSSISCITTVAGGSMNCTLPFVLLSLEADESMYVQLAPGSIAAPSWCLLRSSNTFQVRQAQVSALQAAMASVMTTSTAVSSVAGAASGAASSDAQVLVILSLMSCASPAQAAQVGSSAYLISPFYYSGPLAMAWGNMGIAVGVAGIHGAVTLIRRWRRPLGGDPAAWSSFPSRSFVVFQFLSQGMQLGAMSALWSASATSSSAALAAAGALILNVAVLGYAIKQGMTLPFRFSPYKEFQSEPLWKRFVLPSGYYGKSPLVKKYGAVVRAYCKPRHCISQPVITLMVLATAAGAPPPEYCNAQLAVLVAILFSSAVFLATTRPFRSALETVWTVLSLLTMGVFVVLQVATVKAPLSVPKAAKPAVMLLQSFISVGRTVYHLWIAYSERNKWNRLQQVDATADNENMMQLLGEKGGNDHLADEGTRQQHNVSHVVICGGVVAPEGQESMVLATNTAAADVMNIAERGGEINDDEFELEVLNPSSRPPLQSEEEKLLAERKLADTSSDDDML